MSQTSLRSCKTGPKPLPRARVVFLLAALSVLALVGLAACGQTSSTQAHAQSEPQATSNQAADSAPDFEVVLFSGEPFRLSEMKGRPVVLNFWFPSCPPCRAEMPDLEKASQKYGDDGVVFIGIQLLGLDTEEDGKEFIKDIRITYPMAVDRDNTLIVDYGVTGFPATYFIDKEGNIARRWTGLIGLEDLETIVTSLLP